MRPSDLRPRRVPVREADPLAAPLEAQGTAADAPPIDPANLVWPDRPRVQQGGPVKRRGKWKIVNVELPEELVAALKMEQKRRRLRSRADVIRVLLEEACRE